MRYGSVCSGIEAATAAWHHMGWEPAFFSEIEAFPSAVLTHHYPTVPLHGDFTTIEKNQYGKIDLLVGGTPCQSFSVAGLRGGLDDERGNLALEFCRLAQREQPRWIVWENVPGVLSSNGGRDFGSILGALEDLGYGLAYRVLDAQYFGVAQRRRRVFVVGYLGDWRPAAAVLFERHSMSGHPAPSREARKDIAPTISARTRGGGGLGTDFDLDGGLLATGAQRGDGLAVNINNGEPRLADITGTLDCWSMKGRGSSQQLAVLQDRPVGALTAKGPTAMGAPEVDGNHYIVVHGTQDPCVSTDTAFALGRNNGGENAVAYSIMPMNSGKDYKARETEVAQPIMAGGPVGGNQGGDYIVAMNIYGGNKRADRPEGGFYVKEEPTSKTLDAASGLNPTCSQGGTIVVTPFDTTQITSPHNYSNPQADDPCHPLAAGAHPPAIAFAQNTRDEVRIIGGDGEIAGALAAQPGTKQQTYIAFSAKDHGADATEELSPTLRAGGFTNSHQNGGVMPAVATTHIAMSDPVPPLMARSSRGGAQTLSPGHQTDGHMVSTLSAVRRLTPVECERLQGFPDNFTAIPWRKKAAEDCPDGPRYKALGNSMAVPVMRWIGERIRLVDSFVSLI